MAREFVYPKWIQQAWYDGMFKLNDEGVYVYYNDKYPTKNYKLEFNPIKDYSIQHGDIINFEGGYRNEGKMIWCDNEKRIKDLYSEIDDYGSVPPQFKVGRRFKPNHWVKVIDHNTIIWLEDDLYDQIELGWNDKNEVEGSLDMLNKTYSIIINTNKNEIEHVRNCLKLKPNLHACDCCDELMLYV